MFLKTKIAIYKAMALARMEIDCWTVVHGYEKKSRSTGIYSVGIYYLERTVTITKPVLFNVVIE